MLYNVNDKYIGRELDVYGEFQEKQAALFRAVVKPRQVVVDLGANIGGHTIPLAHHVGSGGQVIAIEPQRVAHTMLCGNIALNALANVLPIRAASGSKSGTSRLPDIDPTQENNFGGVSLIGVDSGGGDEVSVIPLDQLKLSACGFIKVDVEGMELDVLHGAIQTISRCRPVLFVENDRPESSAALISFLLGLGYRLWWHVASLFNPNNFYGEAANVFGDVFSVNMLCIPKEKSVLIALPEIAKADDPYPFTLTPQYGQG
jgi:FkbM family methyltransferase